MFAYGAKTITLSTLGFMGIFQLISLKLGRDNLLNHESIFDEVQNNLYTNAITPVEMSRKRYSLQGWERGTGGLIDEDRLLLGDLYFLANSVFEFGLGESTRIAADVGVPRYAGVDSDAVWISKAREDANMDHFRFSFADVGETSKFGTPVKTELRKIGYRYQVAALVIEKEAFDIYFVDGRYRIACACVSFLHAMKNSGDMTQVMVAIHDNDQKDRNYGIFKRIAYIVYQTEKLWVYKLKPHVTEVDIYHLWEKMVDVMV